MAKQEEKHFSLNQVNTRKFNIHFHASLRPKEAHKSKGFCGATSVQSSVLLCSFLQLLIVHKLLLSNQMQMNSRRAN